MQRTIISKLISGLNASGGASASVSGGSGITVNNGVVAVDNNVVATDTELATQLATKISASDNNLDFTGTNPKFSNALTVENKVLMGNNSGFGIVCLPARNNLTEYSLLFDDNSTLLNKKTTGSGECAIRIGNNNKIAIVDLAGGHANSAIYITPTSVNGSGLTVLPSYVLSNETFQMQAGKDIVVPAGSKITMDGTDFDKTNIASIATNTTNIASISGNVDVLSGNLATATAKGTSNETSILALEAKLASPVWVDLGSNFYNGFAGIDGIRPTLRYSVREYGANKLIHLYGTAYRTTKYVENQGNLDVCHLPYSISPNYELRELCHAEEHFPDNAPANYFAKCRITKLFLDGLNVSKLLIVNAPTGANWFIFNIQYWHNVDL